MSGAEILIPIAVAAAGSAMQGKAKSDEMAYQKASIKQRDAALVQAQQDRNAAREQALRSLLGTQMARSAGGGISPNAGSALAAQQGLARRSAEQTGYESRATAYQRWQGDVALDALEREKDILPLAQGVSFASSVASMLLQPGAFGAQATGPTGTTGSVRMSPSGQMRGFSHGMYGGGV